MYVSADRSLGVRRICAEPFRDECGEGDEEASFEGIFERCYRRREEGCMIELD